MSVITSSLSGDQEKKLLSLFGQVRLHLLYKASVHGYDSAAFHQRCDRQGPSVIAAYNKSGFVFGAYTSKDYAQTQQLVDDEKAFLYSINGERVSRSNGKYGFTDGQYGPDYGGLNFLYGDQAIVNTDLIQDKYKVNQEEMHGGDLYLTEFEVYRVEDLGSLLTKPWRNALWTSERRQQLKTVVQGYKPDIGSVTKARFLLVGPVGAGKSSFFNSLSSVFRGNMTCQAIAGVAGTSLTTQFRMFNIKAGKSGKHLPLLLCDTMGLEEAPGTGLDPEDLVRIYKGHVEDRYQFNPAVPLQPNVPGYRKRVSLKDQIHCVVYVMDACKVSILSTKMWDRLAAIHRRTNQMGIPQLVLMTKVDEACPLVGKDLQKVYHSFYIQKKAQELSASLGVPLSCVLPVKNYSQEIELDVTTDILLLSALDQMLNYADSFFENRMNTLKRGRSVMHPTLCLVPQWLRRPQVV